MLTAPLAEPIRAAAATLALSGIATITKIYTYFINKHLFIDHNILEIKKFDKFGKGGHRNMMEIREIES